MRSRRGGVQGTHGGGGVPGGQAVERVGHNPQRLQGIVHVRRLAGASRGGQFGLAALDDPHDCASEFRQGGGAVLELDEERGCDRRGVLRGRGTTGSTGLDREAPAVSAAAQAICTESSGSDKPYATALRTSET
ncbi:hypothetical protein [Streptomyces niveus]|uniref:hypothetical protein n=1 Tax=Streptomyces niveus TaxID=193462 RepID=UPI00378EDCC6